jgi:anti-sigma regulatory factor (Ser/Thr protein kinase)
MLRELALHVLDLAENSLNAGATLVTIEVIEDVRADRLTLRVTDNGHGIDPELAARVADPFVTTRRTRRVGLGLPFLKQAAEACNGKLMIDSARGAGTTITATFQHSHIDRMPLGDLPGTMLALVVGCPQADFVFRHVLDDKTFEFDSRPLKAELGEVTLSEPSVIKLLKEMLE